ncbi:glycoside hydrolase 15-like protein [Halogeometricum pallidum JCM 14848]|uniref:Glycoside hydrolase 15-like protein n=1 Tax=Halogeometricum pallidum JCM 14848 TaxID=1227487 RepID=M0DEJ0_HALPD|nr:glycoside hydrolase family 15 protein [Halogeometricum pallidum]ELZ33885.1 glycoside hydrolase 15-like protein [Halogeometricum pallidum JCM 14848]
MKEFTPISDYGIVGNLETCALVSDQGAIDWCCFPYLDSPSVFAALFDGERGGTFSVAPAQEYESRQRYLDRTNVLQTTFTTAGGELTLTDFMLASGEPYAEDHPADAVYRKVTCTEGSVDVHVEFEPRFDYARADTRVESTSGGVVAEAGEESLFLSSPVDLAVEDAGDGDDRAAATYPLSANESHWFVAQYGSHEPLAGGTCDGLLSDTVDYWREWAHPCGDDADGTENCLLEGRTHDLAVRSGLVLKLLMRRDTSGICAAPTTSLPEDVGGVRNWDYRYSWIRDGAFTVRALTHLGHYEEASAYLDRFLDLSKEFHPDDIKPLYSMDRGEDLTETELSHLSGYLDSAPVRAGNDAADQRQLDVYGELILAIYQLLWAGREIGEDDWRAVHDIADHICEVWDEPGSGIWEVRGDEHQFVYSKVMCWVGLDRAIQMAEELDYAAAEERWSAVRDEIHETVLDRGYSEELGAFTQCYDDDTLDATGLLIPLTGFLPPDDERVRSTVDAIREKLATEEGLVFRYKGGADPLPGEEGAFVLCSFWLVDALAVTGRVDEAEAIFESVLDYAEPLGLLSEEIDAETGRLLGNFPQAFSHIGLVNAALYLAEARLDREIQPFGSHSFEG